MICCMNMGYCLPAITDSPSRRLFMGGASSGGGLFIPISHSPCALLQFDPYMHPFACCVLASQNTHSLVFTFPHTAKPTVPNCSSLCANGQILPKEHSPREKRPHISFF